MAIDIVPFIFTAFLAGLGATLPPGPIFAVTVAEATRRGFVGGFMVVVGHALVEVLAVVVLTLGLGVFLTSNPVRIGISVLGGFFLVWMGQDLARRASRKATFIREEASTEDGVGYRPLLRGVLAAAANPYFAVWWTVVGGAFILRGVKLLGLLGPIVFLVCHWASDFPWFSFVSLSVGRGRSYLGDRAFRWIIGVCGVFLLALGASFVVEGVRLFVERA